MVASVGGLSSYTTSSKGVINDLFLQPGQRVYDGQLMFTLLKEENVDNQRDINLYLFKQNTQNKIALKQHAKETQDYLRQKIAISDKKLNVLIREKRIIQQQIHQSEKSVSEVKKLLVRIQPLYEKGYISDLTIQQQKLIIEDGSSKTLGLKRELLENEKQIAATTDEIANIQNQSRNLAFSSQEKKRELNAKGVNLQFNRKQFFYASGEGLITNVLKVNGQHVKAGSNVITVLSDASEMKIELYVPSDAIGFVRKDDTITIRYDAFPYQKYGTRKGKVSSVSDTILSASQISELTGANQNEKYYVVTVQPLDKYLVINQIRKPLKQGMTLNADIILEKRTILSWLVDPLKEMVKG